MKLSLFVLYVQVFGPLQWLRYLAWAGAIFTGLFYFIVMAIELAVCIPGNGHSSLAYLAALDAPKCVSIRRPIVIGLGVVSVLSDLYLPDHTAAPRRVELAASPSPKACCISYVLHWISVSSQLQTMISFANLQKCLHSQLFCIGLSN